MKKRKKKKKKNLLLAPHNPKKEKVQDDRQQLHLHKCIVDSRAVSVTEATEDTTESLI